MNQQQYRYVLVRETGLLDVFVKHQSALFVMLNPSTADDWTDDPTLRRVRHFAAMEGAARLTVCNLFAFRATEPAQLLAAQDPVGERNDIVLDLELTGSHSLIVAAWGAPTRGPLRDLYERRVREVLARHAEVDWKSLGMTFDGSPRHPLYVPGATRLATWRPPLRWQPGLPPGGSVSEALDG